MSSNFFLVEYLNSAVSTLRDLDIAEHPKISVFAASLREKISELQSLLHQNRKAEIVRSKLEDAWGVLNNLRMEVEELYTSSKGKVTAKLEDSKMAQEVLKKVASCSLFLSEFQATLCDKLSVEGALGALTELRDQVKTSTAKYPKLLGEKREELISLANKALESVQSLQKELISMSAPGPRLVALKGSFDAALSSVSDLREQLQDQLKDSRDLLFKTSLLEKVTRAQEFLTGFRDRLLAKSTTLELVRTKLVELQDSVQKYPMVTEGREKLLLQVLAAQEKLTQLQTLLSEEKNAKIELIGQYYSETVEKLIALETSQAVYSSYMSLAEKEDFAARVSLIQGVFADTVSKTGENLSLTISLINLSSAKEAIGKIQAFLVEHNSLLIETLGEKVAPLKTRLSETGKAIDELIKANTSKSREYAGELYASTMTKVESLKADLAILEKVSQAREFVGDQYSLVLSSMTAVTDKATTRAESLLDTTLATAVDTAVYVESQAGLVSRASDLAMKALSTAKSIDSERFAGRVSKSLVEPALSKGLDLVRKVDTKLAGGQAEGFIKSKVEKGLIATYSEKIGLGTVEGVTIQETMETESSVVNEASALAAHAGS